STTEGRVDSIAGVYYQHVDVGKTDRFIGETYLGLEVPGGTSRLSTLSGENTWVDEGAFSHYAGFSQLGFKFTNRLKLSVGARYTEDRKKGLVNALVVETGDRFSPNDPRPNITIQGLCTRPDGSTVSPTPADCPAPNQWIYAEGSGFT